MGWKDHWVKSRSPRGAAPEVAATASSRDNGSPSRVTPGAVVVEQPLQTFLVATSGARPQERLGLDHHLALLVAADLDVLGPRGPSQLHRVTCHITRPLPSGLFHEKPPPPTSYPATDTNRRER